LQSGSQRQWVSAAGRRQVGALCILELLDHEIARGCDNVATDPRANDFSDALSNARRALHQDMKIAGVEHQKARARYRA
jgi:hypothetical protein